MDRYRIRALEKILEANNLNDEDRSAAVDMLLNKCAILLKGARKRSNHSIIRQCEEIQSRHSAVDQPPIGVAG